MPSPLGQARPAGLWHNGPYLRYRAARSASILGSGISSIAYPLLVLALGGTPVQAGALASLAFVARLVCRMPGGYVADRFDRRRLMLVMDLVQMLAVASIPLAAAGGMLGFPQLAAVAIAEGAANAVFGPAATALLRDLVRSDDLPAALAHTQATRGAAVLAGPVLGGLCFGALRMLPFTLDAASYGVSAVLLIGLSVPLTRADRAVPATRGGPAAGLRWLWRQPTALRVTLFAGALNLVGAANQIAVVLTLRERGDAAALIGLVMAGSGAGALLGSVVARQLMRLLSPARLCALTACVYAAVFGSLAAAPAPWLVGCLLTLMSVLSPATGMTLAQITLGQTPRALLGRVSTAEQLISGSLAPAGPVLAGVLLQAVGAPAMWLGLAGALVAVAAMTVGPLLVPARAGTGHPMDRAAARVRQP